MCNLINRNDNFYLSNKPNKSITSNIIQNLFIRILKCIFLKIILYSSLINCSVSTTTSGYPINQIFTLGWAILNTVIIVASILAFAVLILLLKFLFYFCLRKCNVIDEYGEYIEKNIKDTLRDRRGQEVTVV
jgi:hypothetical protein